MVNWSTDLPVSGFEEEGELSDPDHNLRATETDQKSSHIMKLYVGSDPLFIGLIYRI